MADNKKEVPWKLIGAVVVAVITTLAGNSNK